MLEKLRDVPFIHGGELGPRSRVVLNLFGVGRSCGAPAVGRAGLTGLLLRRALPRPSFPWGRHW